jgi:hypothetical protein
MKIHRVEIQLFRADRWTGGHYNEIYDNSFVSAPRNYAVTSGFIKMHAYCPVF